MKAYVETNFVLELAFQQEQSASCEEILGLCVARKLRLIVTAYSLIEPYEKLTRQRISRKNLQQDMDVELSQLLRTASYQIKSIVSAFRRYTSYSFRAVQTKNKGCPATEISCSKTPKSSR